MDTNVKATPTTAQEDPKEHSQLLPTLPPTKSDKPVTMEEDKMFPTEHRRRHRRCSSASFTLSLDSHGHVRDPLCSWAPPSLSATSPALEQHRPLYGPTSLSSSELGLLCLEDEDRDSDDQGPPIHEITKTPVVENFPPLFPLPDRSTHNYELECRLHSSSAGMNNYNHVPRTYTRQAQEGGDVGVEGAATAEARQQGPRTLQRRWTLEDQKRIQHIQIMYGAEREHNMDPAHVD